MASQIEQAVASLSAISEQYTHLVDGFFKNSDQSFHDFRTTCLAKIKKTFRRIESHVLASRSPVKSLRKKTRRKPKKATKTRRNKSKSRAKPTSATDSVNKSHDDNKATTQSHNSALPAQEMPTHLVSPAPKLAPVKPPEPHGESSGKHISAERRAPSRRFTRSTGSFQSAVESPIRCPDHSEHHTLDDRDHVHSTQVWPQSPELRESQWEDCRSKPEPISLGIPENPGLIPLERSRGSAIAKESELDRNALEGEKVSDVDLNLGKTLSPTNEASLKPLSLNNTKVQPTDGKSSEIMKSIPQPSHAALTDRERSHEAIIAEESTKSIHSEPEQQLGTHSDSEEDSRIPTRRRQRVNRPVNLISDPDEEKGDSKDTDRRLATYPSPTHMGQTAGSSRNETNHHHPARPSGKPAKKNSSTTQDMSNISKLATDGFQKDSVNSNDFEFKVPKPKPLTTDPTAYFSRQSAVGSAAHRTHDILQTPNAQSNARKQNTVFQERFAVDQGGKISDAGLGILSEIVSTPATSSRDNEVNVLKTGEERVLHGTKLFKPTTNIYSAQRKPVLSRVLSVQKSHMSSGASILSHTPGAPAPTAGLDKLSLLMAPSNSNLRDSLAELKQSITDRNRTKLKLEREKNNDTACKDQPKSSLHRDEQDALIGASGKRLAFADGCKQLDGTQAQSARVQEPRTAPTKESRLPRIRRDTEKSALRRRIEEIRGKASTSTVTNHASSRSSSIEKLPGRLSKGDPDSGKLEDKRLNLGTKRSPQSPEHISEHSAQEKAISTALRPLKDVGTAVLSTGAGLREYLAAEQDVVGSHEQEISAVKEEPVTSHLAFQKGANDRLAGGKMDSCDKDGDEIGKEQEVETETDTSGARNLLSNLMSSVSSLYPGASNLLGVRTNEERREETDAEVAAKRQRLDVERREMERLARIEAQRLARQREAEEKQRRAEARRQLLAEAEKAKEDERKRKEEHRKKVKQHEEEQRKRKKLEEDRKKGERRRQVLEKKAMQLEGHSKRKAQDGKRQRVGKHVERGATGIPKPTGLGGKIGKGYPVAKGSGKGVSPTKSCTQMESDEGGTTSYVMTPAKATKIEDSDDETERRKHKAIPQWAGERHLAISTQLQPDPDKVFVNMPMCNLRDVFGTKKQYRTRSSSANWTQDRVTATEMTKYKQAVGGFRDV